MIPMLSDLNAELEKIFSHYGFYESEKMKMTSFKEQIIQDYKDVYLPTLKKKIEE